jgi:hypothetical protein
LTLIWYLQAGMARPFCMIQDASTLPPELLLHVAHYMKPRGVLAVHLTRTCTPCTPLTPAAIHLWRTADANEFDAAAMTEACELNVTDDARWLLAHGFHVPPSAWHAVVNHRNWEILEAMPAVPLNAACAMMHTGWTAGFLWSFKHHKIRRTPSGDSAMLLCALTYAPPYMRRLFANFIYEQTGMVSDRVLWTLQHMTQSVEAKEWLREFRMQQRV